MDEYEMVGEGYRVSSFTVIMRRDGLKVFVSRVSEV